MASALIQPTDHMANPSALQTPVRETPGPFLSSLIAPSATPLSTATSSWPTVHWELEVANLTLLALHMYPVASCSSGAISLSCTHKVPGKFCLPRILPSSWPFLTHSLLTQKAWSQAVEGPAHPSPAQHSTAQPTVPVQVASLLKEGLDRCVWRELIHGPAF